MKNLETINNFVVNGSNAFLFQITIAKEYTVSITGLEIIVDVIKKCFPRTPMDYHLVFICMKGDHNAADFQIQRLTKDKKIIIDEKVISKILSQFFFNQWIVEV